MSSTETIRKMNEMKLFGMARSLENRDFSDTKDLSGEELLGLLVDDEYLHRKNNRLKRLLQNAKLKLPQSCFEEIDYRHPQASKNPSCLNYRASSGSNPQGMCCSQVLRASAKATWLARSDNGPAVRDTRLFTADGPVFWGTCTLHAAKART